MKKLRKAMKRSERISKSVMVIDFYFYYVFCYHFQIFYHPRRCAVPTMSAHSNFLNFNKKDACDILSLQKIKMNKKNHLNTFS